MLRIIFILHSPESHVHFFFLHSVHKSFCVLRKISFFLHLFQRLILGFKKKKQQAHNMWALSVACPFFFLQQGYLMLEIVDIWSTALSYPEPQGLFKHRIVVYLAIPFHALFPKVFFQKAPGLSLLVESLLNQKKKKSWNFSSMWK